MNAKVLEWLDDPKRSHAAFVADAITYLDPKKGASKDSVLKAHEELGKILRDPARIRHAFLVYREIYEPLGRMLEGEMIRAGTAIAPAINEEIRAETGKDASKEYVLHLEGVLAMIWAKSL